MSRTFHRPSSFVLGAVFVLALAPCSIAQAQDLSPYEFSFRADANAGPGEPTNDMLGLSLIGRYRLNSDWLIGVGFEQASYDFERPYRVLGIPSPEELDASASSTMFSVWAERRYGERAGGSYWYWTAGLGVNSVDVDDLREDSGAFDIKTDAGSETVLSVTAGRRHSMSTDWLVGYGVRVEQRMADWKVEDRVSGEKDSVGDYRVFGLFADITFRF